MESAINCSYSTLSADELLSKIVSQFCIEKPLDCLLWERGANDTYRVRCTNKTYFLRVYRHNAFPREAIEFEAAFLSYLREQGVPVASPVDVKSGGYIAEIAAPEGVRLAMLTRLAQGESPDYDSLEHCGLVGKAAAKMHTVAEGFETPYRRKNLDLAFLLEESRVVIHGHMANCSGVLPIVYNLSKAIREKVDAVPADALGFSVCHGDFHGGNLHVCKGVVTQFDFEECAYGYCIYDLATFKWGVCGGSEECRKNQWPAFLTGYESVRPLSEDERSLIDSFVILRELAETAYGIRHVGDFGHNDIMASDAEQMCERLTKLAGFAGY